MNGSLCDVKVVFVEDKYGLLVKMHHIIGDAWSLALIGTQFNQILNGEVPEAYPYSDYLEQEEKYLQSKRYTKDKDFFLEQFKKCDEATYLSEKTIQTNRSERKTFVVDEDRTKRILSYCENNTAQSMDEFSTMYNVPYAFKVKEIIAEKLQKAVNDLLKRHSALRTRFENVDGTIMQIVDDEAVCNVEELSSTSIEEFIKPFDLAKAPLIRVGYCNDVVMIDIHHIVTDGQSMPIVIKEMNELYMGREIESFPVQYTQFAVEDGYSKDDEEYWLSAYDAVPELEINTDYKRGQKQSFKGSAIYDSVSLDLHNRIVEKCKNLNVTPYVYYMSGFSLIWVEIA